MLALAEIQRIFGAEALAPYAELWGEQCYRHGQQCRTLFLIDLVKEAEAILRAEVTQMGLQKFGTGDGRITETEGDSTKTAGKSVEFTDEDQAALRQENDGADKGEEG